MADENLGALSQLNGGSDGVMGALQQLMQNPIDPGRKDMAYRAGMLGNDGGGGIGAELGNALGAADKVAGQQEALRASYIPHVTAAMIQAQQFELQKQQREYYMKIIQDAGQPSGQAPADPSALPAPGQLGSGMAGAVPPPAGTQVVPPQTSAPIQKQSAFDAINPIGMSRQMAGAMLMTNPGEFFKAQAAAYTPTDLQKTMRAAGIDPHSPQGQAMLQQNIAKTNNIAPIASRPGTIDRDPITLKPLAFNPNVPEGASPVFNAAGEVVGFNPIAGNSEILKENARAAEAGKGKAIPFTGAVDRFGNPLPITDRTSAAEQGQPSAANAPMGIRNNNPGNLRPGGQFAQYPTMEAGIAALDANLASYGKQGVNTLSGVISKWAPPSDNNDTPAYIAAVAKQTGIKPDAPIDLSNPLVRHVLSGAIAVHENGPGALMGKTSDQAAPAQPTAPVMYSAPPLGTETASTNQQNTMEKSFSDLANQNRDAQATKMLLQGIKAEAAKAGVGAFSDRTQFANNLLSYAGVSDKATDAVTAKNLLDKYSNQITAKLGGGANGSDARSAIVAAAYPNSKMNIPAITKAADQLIGAQDATQAKYGLMAEHRNNKDPVGYANTEGQFDTNADARVWQWKAMPPGKERQAFAAQVIKEDPKFPDRIKTLEKMGVLKP